MEVNAWSRVLSVFSTKKNPRGEEEGQMMYFFILSCSGLDKLYSWLVGKVAHSHILYVEEESGASLWNISAKSDTPGLQGLEERTEDQR